MHPCLKGLYPSPNLCNIQLVWMYWLGFWLSFDFSRHKMMSKMVLIISIAMTFFQFWLNIDNHMTCDRIQLKCFQSYFLTFLKKVIRNMNIPLLHQWSLSNTIMHLVWIYLDFFIVFWLFQKNTMWKMVSLTFIVEFLLLF